VTYFDDPWRALAKAAKLRDWETVAAVLEDRKMAAGGGVRDSVLRGQADARRETGEAERLPALEAPEPVTIHDLSAEQRARVEIVNEGSSKMALYRYRPKKAA
jgi:hypothetical protein